MLEHYPQEAPAHQVAVDLFKGEWIGSLPDLETPIVAGDRPLWADACLRWGLDSLDGVRAAQVLELGALEGSHSYVLEKDGAASVLAIEGNSRAFLRCLVVKEILALNRCRFLCGDFMEFLRPGTSRFDLIVASGVLYHQVCPVELIQLLAQHTNRLYLWTHYFDARFMRDHPAIAARFSPGVPQQYAGFAHTVYRQEYRDALDSKLFCGGTSSYSYWLPRQDVLNALEHFGFKEVRIGPENTSEFPGPWFALAARK